MAKYALALGANVGARWANLLWATARLRRLGPILAVSSVYESPAVGSVLGQGPYLNQVLLLETALDSLELLASTQALERIAGRVRQVRNGPRTLDIDVVWAFDGPIALPELQVPHPRMWDRRFVLEPLWECVEQMHELSPGDRERIRVAREGAPGPRAIRLTGAANTDPERSGDVASAVLRVANSATWLGQGVLESLPVVDSTNDYLKARLPKGMPEGAVVVADRQEKGKGRLGRQWWSPSGQGLYCSVLLRPPKPVNGILSILAGLAVNEGIRAVLEEAGIGDGCVPRLKWPNDVLIGDRKCAGVLVEAGTDPLPWVVVGMGININGQIPSTYPLGGTVEQVTGRPWPRPVFFGAIMAALETWYERWVQKGPAEVVAAWTAQSATLGQDVVVFDSREPEDTRRPVCAGIAEWMDEEGALWIREPSGDSRRIVAGELSLRLAPRTWG